MPSIAANRDSNYASIDFHYGENSDGYGDTRGCCSSLRQITWASLRQEIQLLLKIGWPVIVTNFLNFVILSESVMMCGHLTKDELDGAALANSLINALGLSIGVGLCTGCDTLFSQSYGSVNKRRMGTYLLQSLMIIGLFPFLIWAVHINILPILLALGQLPNVSLLAAEYMLWFSPGVIFNFFYLILARYLQNQDRVYAPMLCAVAGNVFNLISQYLCIYVWNFGFVSSAVCQALTFVIMFVLLIGYIVFSHVYVETWNGWDVESLFNWWQFLKLALPGMGMVSLETFCWEVGTFVAGYMGEEELGAQSILFQTETWTFMIALGLSIAVNIRVGQSLGALNGSRAKLVWLAGCCCLLCSATVTTIIFITCRSLLPYMFTNDANIAAIAAGIFPVLGLFQFIDGISCISAGALRGCGRQATGALLVITAYYIIGLPVGIPVALTTSLRVFGLWLGLLIGICITAPTYIFLLCRQDWNRQAELAQERIQVAEERQQVYDTEAELEDSGRSPSTKAKRAASEATALLDDSPGARRLSTASAGGGRRHRRRMPSNPAFVSSIRVVPLRIKPHAGDPKKIWRMALTRLAIGLACLGILLIGVIGRVATQNVYYNGNDGGGLNETTTVNSTAIELTTVVVAALAN
ncbi:hypothetical protein BOX15_Mlig012118g2 [Macrostomum lignano]|uniref:Multidrug and toxin extrusion protein n=2 Tax=Macrostomum lignano TaxID=282301 RepID=A0A267DY16_9PLAT|nr:hypothetical protein BOX15_Mlig012118g1 [Macrostomum lignano]PAA73976.1 hypothetical protein BOX15_Mlig012118g2 [Macrostomum lignano]